MAHDRASGQSPAGERPQAVPALLRGRGGAVRRAQLVVGDEQSTDLQGDHMGAVPCNLAQANCGMCVYILIFAFSRASPSRGTPRGSARAWRQSTACGRRGGWPPPAPSSSSRTRSGSRRRPRPSRPRPARRRSRDACSRWAAPASPRAAARRTSAAARCSPAADRDCEKMNYSHSAAFGRNQITGRPARAQGSVA